MKPKKIRDDKYILNIMRNIRRAGGVNVTVYSDGKSARKGRIEYIRKTREIMLTTDVDIDYKTGDKLGIYFQVQDIFYVIRTSVVEFDKDKVYRLEYPNELLYYYHRVVTRYMVKPGDNIGICFGSSDIDAEVVDISTAGARVRTSRNIFKKNTLIRNAQVVIDENTRLTIDMKVIHHMKEDKEHYIGLKFINAEWYVYYRLFSYIFSKNYPRIASINSFPRDAIYKLYEDSGYLDLKPREESEKNFDEMVKLLQILDDKPLITTNMVYHKDNELLAGASVLRIYNNTFLAQHLAAVPKARLHQKALPDIYLGLNDFLVNHPYFKYYLTYFDSRSHWHSEMYRRIGEYINDKNKFIYDTLQYFECYLDRHQSKPAEGYRAEVISDPTCFFEYCKDSMERLTLDCYGYTPENYKLGDIRQLYELLGLYIDRRLVCSYDNEGNTAAYAVAEAYTIGLNLYNILDNCIIYFCDNCKDIPSVVNSLLPEIKLFFRKYKKRKFNLLVDIPESEIHSIDDKGLKYDFLVGRVVADREGGVE